MKNILLILIMLFGVQGMSQVTDTIYKNGSELIAYIRESSDLIWIMTLLSLFVMYAIVTGFFYEGMGNKTFKSKKLFIKFQIIMGIITMLFFIVASKLNLISTLIYILVLSFLVNIGIDIGLKLFYRFMFQKSKYVLVLSMVSGLILGLFYSLILGLFGYLDDEQFKELDLFQENRYYIIGIIGLTFLISILIALFRKEVKNI